MKTQVTILLLLAAGTAMAQRGGHREGRKPPTAADFIPRLDQDGDGRISTGEFDGPTDAFTQFDANGDGYLGEDEAPSGPPPRGQHGSQEEQGQGQQPPSGDGDDQSRPEGGGFASRLDQDGDGMVSESEFDGPAEHFSQLDANGDGYLSDNEAPSGPPPRGQNGQQEGHEQGQQPSFGQRSDGSRPEGGGFASRLDQDGDGMVSASEFDGPAEHFSQFDANGDGYLSDDETPSGPPPGRNR